MNETDNGGEKPGEACVVKNPHNLLQKTMDNSLTDLHLMNKSRTKMTDCILNLSLEIIYLLSGEDYTVVKKTSDKYVTPSSRPPHVSGGWSRSPSPIMEPSPHSLIPESNNEQKILELTNKMICLLSGEVPIRCQDVTVYFSMEEWEYLEGHKDLYKEVMMDDPQTLTSPDGSRERNPSGRCPRPLYSKDCPEEDGDVLQKIAGDGLLDQKSEAQAGKDKTCITPDLHCEEEEAEDVSPGSHNTRSPQMESPHRKSPTVLWRKQKDPPKTDKHRSMVHENLLNLALEIIYLLSGEDYTVVKKTSDKYVTPSSRPHVSGGWSRSLSPIMEPSPHSLTPESNNEQKILELTNKMICLLSGEVPIRCQDVTVYFSMEEWEYLEGHKDLYKEVMMDDHQTLTSPDGSSERNPPNCPLYTPDCPGEDRDVPQDDQDEDLLHIKVEVIDEEEEEIFSRPDQQCESSERHSPERCPLYSQDCLEGNLDVPQDSQGEDLIDIKVEVVDEGETYVMGHRPCKEEQIPVDIGQGCHIPGGENLLPPDYETEDNIAPDFCYEDPLMLNMHHGPAPFSDPLYPEGHPEKTHSFTPDPNHRVFKIFPCSECGRRFARRANLLRHKRSHTRPFFCADCGKSFTFKFRLIEHQRFHTGEKPFACPECGKCFMHRENLFKHKKTHNGDRPFICDECGKSFSQKSYLIEHLKFHMGEKPYSCSECGKPFSKKSVLVKHLRIHAEQKPLICFECGKCFTKKAMLAKHQRSHLGLSAYICTECGKCFKKKSVLVDHQRTHTGERPFPCMECGKSFTKKSVLVAHQRIHTGEKPFSCLECEKCFTQKSGLIAHQKVHEGKRKRFSCLECGECKCICTDYITASQQTEEKEEKPYLCLHCGKCFTQKAGLVKHQRIHTGDRPFSCLECGKCFTLKDRLERHQRSHSGEKPFSCSVCGKSFTHKSSLADHQRTHTGERPFPCLECGKCFIQKSDLVRHQRIHSGEKPYSCTECGKSFIHRSDLVVHQRIHTGEKLYSCAECGRGFTRRSQFEIHQRSHTGERPFTCPECGKCFNQKSNLVRHQGTHYLSKVTKMSLLDGITIDVPHSQMLVT
ncbi:uncharacterized protein LOC142219329 isoform X1 [Leptodactylus fuscus]|uniref:uncharacterized protein LOC142219329 isoform X1 n=3 Tax=Leptodactylus fuscus TaxID=238119 RepID=UPI003F4E8E03